MEKKILVYSYWLGMLCVALALLWRGASAFGFSGAALTRLTLGYMTFFKGALLFLITAMATSAYQSGNR